MDKWKKILGIHRHVPRSSYILRIVVGAYLIYLSYQIIGDLIAKPSANPGIMITAAVVFCLTAVFCLLCGGIGLYLKEYREAYAEEEEETKEPADDKSEEAESREIETVEVDKEDETEK